MERYYTIYQITNLTNGMIYIGHHVTENLNDKYMGSGRMITDSIRVEGIENFKREILFIYDNKDDMRQKEKELMSDEFRRRQDTYNIALGGGGGGQIGVKLKPRSAEFIEKQRQSHLGVKRGPHSEEYKRKLSESHKGKTHTEETKEKIRNKRALQICTDETREKMSKSKIGKKMPPRTTEHTENLRQSLLGKKRKPERPEITIKRIENVRRTKVGKVLKLIICSIIQFNNKSLIS